MKIIVAFLILSLAFFPPALALADTFGSGSNMFDVEFVTIGDPGNSADTTGDPNPAGSVDYIFRMGKYEISEDMITKANAQSAADGDPLNITYHDFGAGSNKPATDITWYEAAKFVNWLNISKGSSPAYKFDSDDNFQLWQSGDAGYNLGNPFRNSRAYYFLPSADEWYKAAYYDPTAGVYYDYPTSSDSVPDGIDFAGDTTFDAVYNDGGRNFIPNDVSNVGLLSPYGTAGQGGNVIEWEETEYDLVNDTSSSARGARGGDESSLFGHLRSSYRVDISPTDEGYNVGFRVAAIPEPGTTLLGAMAAGGLLVLRRW